MSGEEATVRTLDSGLFKKHTAGIGESGAVGAETASTDAGPSISVAGKGGDLAIVQSARFGQWTLSLVLFKSEDDAALAFLSDSDADDALMQTPLTCAGTTSLAIDAADNTAGAGARE